MTLVQLRGLPLVKMSAQSDVIYRSYYSKTPKMGPVRSGTRKPLLFVLRNVENTKCSEAETWHPEGIDG